MGEEDDDALLIMIGETEDRRSQDPHVLLNRYTRYREGIMVMIMMMIGRALAGSENGESQRS